MFGLGAAPTGGGGGGGPGGVPVGVAGSIHGSTRPPSANLFIAVKRLTPQASTAFLRMTNSPFDSIAGMESEVPVPPPLKCPPRAYQFPPGGRGSIPLLDVLHPGDTLGIWVCAGLHPHAGPGGGQELEYARGIGVGSTGG